MTERKAVTSAPFSGAEEPSKAQLQQEMNAARATIAQTVEDIKETVSEQVESVKETVSDVLDWNEHFKKNPLVWGAAAVGAGLVIGYSIAVMRQGEDHKKRRGSNQSVADGLLGELAVIGENILLPAVNDRLKSLFGIDLSAHLIQHKAAKPKRAPVRKSSRKGAASKRTTTTKAIAQRATKKKGA